MTPMDQGRRTDVPDAFDERSILLQQLRYARATVHAKCAGLSQEHADGAPLPGSPAMTVTGLVNHLRWSEAFWVDVVFLGGAYHWPGTDNDSELQMRAGHGRPIGELLEEYAAQAARTDEVLATRDWDDETTYPDEMTGRPLTLAYVVGHLIGETARHNGHLDVLRELADGTTGD